MEFDKEIVTHTFCAACNRVVQSNHVDAAGNCSDCVAATVAESTEAAWKDLGRPEDE